MKITCVFVFLSLAIATASAGEDSFENNGVRVALKLYDDCSKSGGFSQCLKKKALTFLDRLGRMQKLSLTDGVTVSRVDNGPVDPPIDEVQLEKSLPRGADAQDQILNSMLFDKAAKILSSRSIEITLPKISSDLEEGRGKKMKGMMGGMMMGIVAKMAALIPVAIAGLFLLAGKALITAKIALLLSGIIALKKLVAAKQGGGHGGGGHGGGHSSGGWQSSGGGWDKRSLDEINEAQKYAYKAYAPK